MPTYDVTVREAVAVDVENPASQDKTIDDLIVTETFTGQDQLTSQLISVIETFGVPIVTSTELITLTETFYVHNHYETIHDVLTLTEGFDISTSVFADAETYDSIVSVTETFGVGGTFGGVNTERLAVYETFFAFERVDYMDQDQYYYSPRQ